jgi:hypothetical protein
MKTLPDGRAIFIPDPDSPPYVNRSRLADALVAAVVLLNVDEVPMWPEADGKLTGVSLVVLRELVARFVATPKLGFTADGAMMVQYEPYVVGDVDARVLLTSRDKLEGGLLPRLPPLLRAPPPVVQPKPPPKRARAQDAA